ncbi:MAG: DUF2442 domain-containing protein [Bdellovibrionales bacterium]|nr:DUF2442 domain-containing protein [Bdellovibrionales bacterium]
MRKILSVKSQNFILECEMENGDIYTYDMSFIKNESGTMIEPLKKESFFNQVFLELGSLSWPNGYEIHANTVERDGHLISKAAS